MKSRKSRYSLMLALMITSQVLLTGFISYWLVNRYKQERTRLRAELEHSILTAYDRQVDSLLMKHLIAPTLSDSVMLRVDLSEVHTVLPAGDSDQTSVLFRHFESDSLEAPNVFAFKMNDSIHLDEDRLVRSVRLFINETDEAFRTNTQAHAFSMKIDSAALLQMLDDQFKRKAWDFKLEWCCGPVRGTEADGNRGLVLTTLTHNELPALQIQHIGPYLLSQIWPESVFALILLTLSASSLVIVYRSLRRQVALNELRNDFIANISHELKTPVSTIKVALEALQKFDLKKDPKVSADYLEMASREAVRLESLVGKVLQHQVLESPVSLIRKEACDLGQILVSALKSTDFPVREGNAGIQTIVPEHPCTVMADPVYLEGVIINLIDNSLKYAGPHPEIEIAIECTGKTKKLMVRDNGPGIPDEYKHQVFDKFFRIP